MANESLMFRSDIWQLLALLFKKLYAQMLIAQPMIICVSCNEVINIEICRGGEYLKQFYND